MGRGKPRWENRIEDLAEKVPRVAVLEERVSVHFAALPQLDRFRTQRTHIALAEPDRPHPEAKRAILA